MVKIGKLNRRAFMKCNLYVIGKTLVVKISGDIDHHSTVELKEKIVKEYMARACVNLIFDFSLLEFMDSAGIGMIIGRYKQVSMNGGNLFAVGITPKTERIFRLSGLNKLVKSYPTVEAALNVCNEGKEVI
jgi:stage II sporulation protein AA (anti-sigma F factor antagonist)